MNPKLEGSNIIDCIPVAGHCPNNCFPCYWNDGSFYRDINTPILPTLEEVGDKIVRINSGKDSTIDFTDVLLKTFHYPKKFYNTSLPTRIYEFPAPVVFTCNPNNIQWFYALSEPFKLMAVRIRVCSWNLNTVNNAVLHYVQLKVPILLTFLYFNDEGLENISETSDYNFEKHIKGNRWIIKPQIRQRLFTRYYHFANVFQCGSAESHLCKDCGNCERLYQRAMALYF